MYTVCSASQRVPPPGSLAPGLHQLCHNAQTASKNVALHTPDLIANHAAAVYPQVCVLKRMPMNNATQNTDAERAQIKHGFEAGAALR